MDLKIAQHAIDTVVPLFTEYGLDIVAAIAILIAGRFASRFLQGLTRRAMIRAKADPAVVGFTTILVKWLVIAFVVVAALAKLGVHTTSFVAVIGAAGLAVGLAMQGSLSNFASGVLILIFRPFRIGDFVETGDKMGTVEEIGLFTTRLLSIDNKRILVPNAQVTQGVITNFTAMPTRRVDLTASISYGDDIGKARDILLDICRANPLVLDDPPPQVELMTMGESSLDLTVRPWCMTENYWTVRFELTRRIKERFDEAGITIPFQQRDVHIYEEKKGG